MTRSTTAPIEDKIDQVLADNEAGAKPGPASLTKLLPGGAPKKTAAKKAPAKAPAKKAAPPRKVTPRKSAAPKDQPAQIAPDTKAYELTGFSTRDVPWGKLGAVLEGGAVTAAEAAERGGLNFDVELLEAGFKSSVKPTGHTSPWRTVKTRRACVRQDTQQFFSYVSADYAPIQYAEAFAFMDEVHPKYVAAGALGGGKQGFMVVELPEKHELNLKIAGKEDPLQLYVVLRTSHDLTRALEVSVMALRGRCMNALTLKSFTRGAEQRWSVRHVGKDPLAKLEAARVTLAHADAYVNEFKEIAQRLAAVDIEVERAREILKLVLPDRPKRDDQVNAIVHAWRESPTNGFRDNGWGLTNAVSEYFEWGRNDGTRTAQSRFTGGLNGPTHRFSNRTAQLLLRNR